MTGIEVLLMCGIAGFCRWDGDFTRDREGWSQVLVRMRRSLAHRGHDQTGEYLDRWVGLAHTRLSIRDLAGGGQPMVRQRAGKDFAIVYNGEIYNTGELTPELEKLGYRFETTCDTEVILYAYMAWGLDFAEKLNGIYALAVWDGAEGRLVLCRDRLGVKPLFYTVKGGALVFGSEPKALFRHPQVRPEADGDSFREIFGVGPARTPGVGVFRGVGEVKPGHLAVFDRECLREYTYWSLEARPHRDSYEQTVEELELGDYVRARYAEALKAVPALPEETGDDLRRRQVSCLNIRWFMQTLLDRMDRASMSCGLEARVPFADHRLVEYLYNVPWEMKFQNGVEKALLRDACKDLLPPELLYRKKSPYPKTYSPRYEALLQQRFRRLLADKSAPIHRFLDREKAERALSTTQDNGRPWFGQLMAGPQMLAYLLQVNDWMERYQVG